MPPGSLEQVISRMDALWLLEAQGLPILNPPKSLEACVDKLLCTGRLTTNGIPTPATIACETVDTGLLGFAELGNDVVVKPVFGSEGNGLVRLTDPDTAGRVFRSLESIRSLIYLQEYVPNEGFDLRLLVLAGRVLGAMKRYVPKGEFRANASRGARCEAYEPSEEEAKLACRATKITGAVFAGVDLLHHRDTLETYCIEVNSIPGFQALEATGQEIAPAVIQHLMDMVGTAASAKASRRQ
jgi:ribosomal protein S6--L-glutamate ligase